MKGRIQLNHPVGSLGLRSLMGSQLVSGLHLTLLFECSILRVKTCQDWPRRIDPGRFATPDYKYDDAYRCVDKDGQQRRVKRRQRRRIAGWTYRRNGRRAAIVPRGADPRIIRSFHEPRDTAITWCAWYAISLRETSLGWGVGKSKMRTCLMKRKQAKKWRIRGIGR